MRFGRSTYIIKSAAAAILALCNGLPMTGTGQVIIANFSLPSTEGIQQPVFISIDGLRTLPDTSIAVMQRLADGRTVPVPFQISRASGNRQLCLALEPNKEPREFQIVRNQSVANPSRISVDINDSAATIRLGDRRLLRYNHRIVYPPAGVDSAYRRGAFIHPVWSPHGQVLTRIQPPDHYHHYGIWNPWTHILFEGDTLDLWNLNRHHGTVRFAGFTDVAQGPVFAGYTARHDHVSFKGAHEKILLNELQTVRIYNPAKADYYIADIMIKLACASASSVRLLEYRYGGLGWRTTGEWDRNNSTVVTSQGRTRKNADGTTARWCIVQGEVGGDHAGIVMMSHPDNYNHPEPLRIWPEDQYQRGDMFFNFSPTRNTDWLLEPGIEYVLKYRMLVFNGKYDAVLAEQAWQQFAQPASSANRMSFIERK